MAGIKRRIKIDNKTHAFYKELDEVSCPICMEHPHNAILLLCSSHEKGCRPYICDTSYRHSNCLDRFNKLRNNLRSNATSSSSLAPNRNISDVNMALRANHFEANENHNSSESNVISSVGVTGNLVIDSIQDDGRHLEAQGSSEAGESGSFQRIIGHEVLGGETSQSNLILKCPLCRGKVLGWKVTEEARRYLNMKQRSCSRESCSFHGNYQELRRHARRVHPTSCPSDIDPSRERSWQRFVHQREHEDIISAAHSTMPGAVIVGDYMIEEGDRLPFERGPWSNHNGPWWTSVVSQMMGSASANTARSRARSRAWLRHRRLAGALSENWNIWGENLLGLQDDDDSLRIPSDGGQDASPVRRRRRRLTWSRASREN